MNLASVEGFLTAPGAVPLEISVSAGARLAVLGPSPSGKTRLLEALSASVGRDIPLWNGEIRGLSPRATPGSVLKRFGADAAARALVATGLWDQRSRPIRELQGGERRVCSVLEPLAAGQGVALLDEVLDRFDPWRLASLLRGFAEVPDLAVVAVTTRPDLAAHFGTLAVLGTKGLRWFGKAEDLRRRSTPATMVAETENSAAVRSVARAIGVRVLADEDQLVLQLEDGLEQAVELCLKGYAHLRAVTIRTPSLTEALVDLPL